MNSLRNKTGKALIWVLIGDYSNQIINFLISLVLARLLAPSQFGLVGMSMAFISLLQVFKDMGFASALVQNKTNDSLTYSSIFYLNVAAGLILTVVVYFSAPFVGEFYNNEDVTLIIRLLSINFFLSSFNIVQGTILVRELNFKTLAYRDVISKFISGGVAIYLAFDGFGVFSLVAQQILNSVLSTIFLWNVTKWYPKLEFSLGLVKQLASFSVYVFAGRFLDQLVKQLDTLVIGKLYSAATLGFFSRAKSLNGLVIKNSAGILNKVFFPALSSIQDDKARFEKIYIKILSMVSAISVLLTGVFYISGAELIIGLFGAKWEPSVPIFKILIIEGFTYPLNAVMVSALLAAGKSKENFYYGNIRKVIRFLPILFAYLYGFEVFIIAYVTVGVINWFLNTYFIQTTLQVSFIKQLKAVLPFLISGALIVLSLTFFINISGNYLITFLKVILFGAFYILILFFTKNDVLNELKYYLTSIWQKLGTKSKGD
jgi:O-antigen/teichoic acid export membrane protein